ncbi:MAG: GIY-YIG nuclease family protein [Bacteroidota bacterium]
MAYALYVLYSRKADRYYIGYSADPVRRLHFHNTIEKGFTSRFRRWELVWSKAFATKSEAQAAERKVKSWKSKIMVKKLITGEVLL